MTNDKFSTLFGQPVRRPEQDLLTQFHMDIAASIQAVTEHAVIKPAGALRRETQARNLCMAGGVALNCVANGKLLKEGIFDSIWMQPAAGDAGGAVGAALAAPPALTVATDMLYALVISASLLHLLLSTRGAGDRAVGKPASIMPWLRALGWLVLAVMLIALLAGYARFAAFVAIRLVSAVAVLGVLYLVLVLAGAPFVERLAADTPRHQLVGTDVGVTASRIDITSLCISLGLMLAALFLAIGPW